MSVYEKGIFMVVFRWGALLSYRNINLLKNSVHLNIILFFLKYFSCVDTVGQKMNSQAIFVVSLKREFLG